MRQERAEALAEGEKAGRRQEAFSLLQRLIATRLGAISTTAATRAGAGRLSPFPGLAGHMGSRAVGGFGNLG